MAKAKAKITKIRGKFRIDVVDSRGKRHRPTFDTRDEAITVITGIEAQKQNGEFLASSTATTFDKALDLLLKRNEREGLAKASRVRVASIINAHLRPTFGNRKLSEFPAQRMRFVQEWLDHRAQDHGAAAMSLQHALSYIRMALDEAIKAGLLNSPNPVSEFKVRVPRINEREERKVLTLDEISKLVSAASRRDHGEQEAAFRVRFLLVLMGLLLGLRDQECGALCWDCINFEDRTIHVRRKIENGELVNSTKTGRRGFRTIPMNPILCAALLSYRDLLQSQGCPIEGPVPVLRPGRSELVTQGAVGDHWNRLAKKAGFVNQAWTRTHTYYTLRHTCLNLWRTIDVRIDRLSTLAGHTNINTTHSRYLHETPHYEVIRSEVHALGLEQTSAGLIDGLGIVLARRWMDEGIEIVCAPPRSMTPQLGNNNGIRLLPGNIIDVVPVEPAVPSGPVNRSVEQLRAWQMAECQKLHAQGWTKSKIAEQLGLCRNTISDWIRTVPDAKWMRKTSQAEKAEMRKQVAKYRDAHPEVSSTAIAERFGLKPYLVARWEKQRGLRMPHQPGAHKLGKHEARIREMFAQGKTTHEMAAELGRSASGIALFINRLGLRGGVRPAGSGRQSRKLWRHEARIRDMVARGMSAAEISRELVETSRAGVAGFIARNGLRGPAESN